MGSKGKLALHRVKGGLKKLASLTKRFLNNCFSVEVQKIECEYANLDLYILNLDILLLACHKLLEGQHLLLVNIPGYCLTIQDKALGIRLNPGVKFGKDIRVLLGKILGVSGENASNTSSYLLDCTLARFVQLLRRIFCHIVDLRSFAIILVLAGESLTFKAIKDFSNSLGWFGQHGLQRYTRSELAVFSKLHDTMFENCGDNYIVAGKLAIIC
jgi:hypothetical protein